MNTVICSDLHLGRPFAVPAAERAAFVREELGIPGKLAELAVSSGARTIFVAGDLFDDYLFTDEIFGALCAAFAAVPQVHVFIVPGCSDPYTPESPYARPGWPDNVHIFHGKMKAFELDAGAAGADRPVRIYGAGLTTHNASGSPFNPARMPNLDPDYLNILMLHDVPRGDNGEPLTEALRLCGFDLCIFGHSHTVKVPEALGNTVLILPGTLIPHTAEELEHAAAFALNSRRPELLRDADRGDPAGAGLYTGVVEQGRCDLTFMPLFSGELLAAHSAAGVAQTVANTSPAVANASQNVANASATNATMAATTAATVTSASPAALSDANAAPSADANSAPSADANSIANTAQLCPDAAPFYVSELNIAGFGGLSDRSCTLAPGLNCVYGSNESGKSSFLAFITAIFCGFREDYTDIPESETLRREAVGLLPSRKATRPRSGGAFGGDLSFTLGEQEFIVSADWAERRADDMLSVIRVGGHAEKLLPGETVSGKYLGLHPLDLVRFISPAAGAGAAQAALSTLEAELQAREQRAQEAYARARAAAIAAAISAGTAATAAGGAALNSAAATAAGGAALIDAGTTLFAEPDASQPNTALTNAEAQFTASLSAALTEHKADVDRELAELDALEEASQRTAADIRKLEKEKAEAAAKVRGELSVSDICELGQLETQAERAQKLAANINDLRRRNAQRTKKIRGRRAAMLVPLWLLTVLDVAAIVLLVLFPVDWPVVGPILEKLAENRLMLLAGGAVLFVLLIILIAAASSAGIRELAGLDEELYYNMRQLGDLLGNGDGAATDPADADEFMDNAAPALDELSKKAGEAHEALLTAADLGSSSGERVSRLGELTRSQEQLSGRAAALREELERRPSYGELREKAAALDAALRQLKQNGACAYACGGAGAGSNAGGNFDAPGSETPTAEDGQRAAQTLAAAAAVLSASDIGTAAPSSVETGFIPELTRRAGNALAGLTGGKRDKMYFTEDLLPQADENGQPLDADSYGGVTRERILLSAKLAEQGAARHFGLSYFVLFDEPFARFDAANAGLALEVLASRTDCGQVIYTTSSKTQLAGETVEI